MHYKNIHSFFLYHYYLIYYYSLKIFSEWYPKVIFYKVIFKTMLYKKYFEIHNINLIYKLKSLRILWVLNLFQTDF